ncbi:hypothetical protein F5J12DRAFT_843393 [Pisolithus orientalis]|uniref:uncharacterized protein n=1 Tax=Pisolithus orientalis TaxID=936130 RepID=UPI0022250B70|nr:uncharacterized protein F5J12DRAFT_843393 [Pisolithus orientalis]KAI6001627.1 hypothetical protein F5J12DRAFT_843393 [Pisolithus orientalis]
MSGSPTREELHEVAKVTMRILRSCGIPCFLVGGMACSVYGTSRLPNDIDMAVMTDEDAEFVKSRLVCGDARFYLVKAKNIWATYKVLWFSLSTSLYSGYRRSCKIREVKGLPVAPLLLLLCLKLQCWDHHGAAIEWRYRSKQPADAGDINELLRTAVANGENLAKERWMPEQFVRDAEERVRRFLHSSWDTQGTRKWKALGFRTD